MFVYCLTNVTNQKRYIGITTQRLRRRITGHFLDAKRPRQQARLIVKAIKKYGRESFTWEMVATATTLEELYEMERQAIQDYNTFYRDGHGYNMTRGGEGAVGYTHTPEVRAQVSQRFKGKALPAEHKEKIGAAQRGAQNHQYRADVSPKRRARLDRQNFLRALPPEEHKALAEIGRHQPRTAAQKEALRQKVKERWATVPHPFLGRHHTEATRAKLAEATRAHLAAHGNPRSIPVTYEGVTYPHIKAAMQATGRDRGIFRRLLRQTPEPTHFTRRLELEGVYYASIKQAIALTGRSRWYIYACLRDGRAHYVDDDDGGCE